MNVVTGNGDKLVCSCGAKLTEAKDKNRFVSRHPLLCSKKKEVAKKLAEGTKSVVTSQEEDLHLFRLESIEAEGRNLSDWEKKFVLSVRRRVETSGSSSLSSGMIDSLEKIYTERVP